MNSQSEIFEVKEEVEWLAEGWREVLMHLKDQELWNIDRCRIQLFGIIPTDSEELFH
jgi:hypothetical protein